jgi:hypothetical protein
MIRGVSAAAMTPSMGMVVEGVVVTRQAGHMELDGAARFTVGFPSR